jgi:hypothetical protein
MYLSINLSIYLSIYLPTYLSMYQPTYLSIYLPIYVSTYLPIYLSTYLCIYLSIYLPIYVSTYLSIYLSMYLYIYLSPRSTALLVKTPTINLFSPHYRPVLSRLKTITKPNYKMFVRFNTPVYKSPFNTPVYQVAPGNCKAACTLLWDVVHFPGMFTSVKADCRTNKQNTWLTESHGIDWHDWPTDRPFTHTAGHEANAIWTTTKAPETHEHSTSLQLSMSSATLVVKPTFSRNPCKVKAYFLCAKMTQDFLKQTLETFVLLGCYAV